MAFNFFSGGYSSPRMTSLDDMYMYQDPRRQGSMGSFNPSAMEFGDPFAALLKGGASPTGAATKPPVTSAPPAPYLPTLPGTQPGAGKPSSGASSTYRYAGTPGPTDPGYPTNVGTPMPKPGSTPGASGAPGAFNYAAYPTIEALYGAHPGGLPEGFDFGAWARATGQPDPRYHTASGEPITFTWNPNGPGYYNPQTGETYDRPGETYPTTPASRPPPTIPNLPSPYSFGSLPLRR